MTIPSRLRWLWLTLAVVLLDRATKAWFDTQTTESWRHELVHHFVYLVHSTNPGIAFGVLSDSASAGTRMLLIAGSIVVISVLAWLLVASHGGGPLTAAGLGLFHSACQPSPHPRTARHPEAFRALPISRRIYLGSRNGLLPDRGCVERRRQGRIHLGPLLAHCRQSEGRLHGRRRL